MKRIRLTPTEKSNLELRHSQCKNTKEADRIKAVLLRSEGWTVPMISQALRIHETTVTRHLNDYREGKLNIASGGSNSMLSESHTKELISHLKINTYPSTHEIIKYVKRHYNISYSVPGMNKWLHRNGFSFKKPKGTPHKADQALQDEFIETYEEIKTAIKPDEKVLFIDSCHPSMATKISYGWIKKGEDKPISTTASRTRVNILGALELGNISKTITSNFDTINGESVVTFLKLIRKRNKSSGCIHIILDGAGYHKCGAVAEAATKLNMKLLFLPPYSPNLNPIERLWKIMNQNVRNNVFFNSAKEFRESISNFFKKVLPKIGGKLDSIINDNFQTLSTAFSS